MISLCPSFCNWRVRAQAWAYPATTTGATSGIDSIRGYQQGLNKALMDIVDKPTRSRMMGTIRGRNTAPELLVRRFLHKRGFRYSLHVGRLPGRPDIVLPRYGVVVLVHGCFWHRHKGCRYAYTPRTNRVFWESKFAGNVARDARNLRALRSLGWRVYTVWECKADRPEHLAKIFKSLKRKDVA